MLKKSDIPVYQDPDSFELLGEQAKFPNNTQNMVYNPLTHMYFLTPEGLQSYGINAVRKYISDNPDKIQELIQKTSKKVYDYIFFNVGVLNYQTMLYRIAAVPKKFYPG